MIDQLLTLLTFCTALGCALIAGVFFAFSAFVMPALTRLPAAQGMRAMQSINVVAVTPAFMTAFLGTGAACVLLAGLSLSRWQQSPNAVFLLAGSLLYLAGTILVTGASNVPRNNRLAAVDPSSADSSRLWAEYVTRWTAWNHVRAAAALAAAAFLTIALARGGVG